jgi:hypothetical protein
MSDAYDRIKEALNEALAFAQGETTGAVVHQIAVPRVDVAAIRATTGLSQSQFAEDVVERVQAAPADELVIDRLARPISFGCIALYHPMLDDIKVGVKRSPHPPKKLKISR